MAEQAVEILLVEDNPDDVNLALHALRRHHLVNNIRILRDGVEALDYLFATGEHADRVSPESLKVVLLDLKLPRIDGLEVLRRMKSDPCTKTIPVVVLTSSREERDIVKSYELGVNSYIVKPVDFEHFSETVRQLGLYWLVVNETPKPIWPASGETD